jgi:Fe-S cluster assembly protein SufB
MPGNEMVADIGLEEYKYGFVTEESTNEHVYKARPGLSEQIVRDISAHKNEPEWMLDFRLKALEVYYSKPMPRWGGDLDKLDATLDEIYYYLKPQEKMERSWDDVPQEIKDTFEKLGIPEAERKALAGVGAQYESEMVYHSL